MTSIKPIAPSLFLLLLAPAAPSPVSFPALLHEITRTSLLSLSYLQQAVPLGVQRPLQLEHVLELLGVDELVREEDGQAVDEEAHLVEACWLSAGLLALRER